MGNMKHKINTPLVSVVVPTSNRLETLKKLLKGLSSQSLKNFEIILIFRKDSKQTEHGLQDQFSKLNIRAFDQKSPGLVNARNTGIDYSRGKYLIFTDDDVIPTKDWIREVVGVFDSSKRIGGVTGPSLIPLKYRVNRDLTLFFEKFKHGNIFWKLLGKLYINIVFDGNPYKIGHFYQSGAFGLGANYSQYSKTKHDFEVMDLQACNLAVRKTIAKKLAGYDTSFNALASYSESDFSFRIRKLGYILVFCPKAVVHHTPSKAGVFKERISAKSEMENFLLFYFRHIYNKSFTSLFKFAVYLMFTIFYRGIYQSARNRTLSPLFGTISGTISGFSRALGVLK